MRKIACKNWFTEEQKERVKQKLYEKSKKINDCWIYQGYGGKLGYILISFDGCYVKAHRASYMAYKGEIPFELQICHTCDNRACVNPDHLYLGTAKDNARDRDQRGRKASTKGSKNGANKLIENQVIEIKKMLMKGDSLHKIATLFNVSKSNIWCIKKGMRWSHINVNN